jgi:hypothetical protein
VFAVFAVLVLAQTANPYLDLARGLARELKFSAAIEQLQVARQVPNLDTAQRVEVLELLARFLFLLKLINIPFSALHISIKSPANSSK